MIQRLPVLLCPYCEYHTALPSRTRPETSELEPYWPMDSDTLTLVCHNCRRLSVHWERGIHTLGIQSEDPGQPPSVFWRVEFSCSHARCDKPIVVHTRTEDSATSEEVVERVKQVVPKQPECAVGHKLGRLKKSERIYFH